MSAADADALDWRLARLTVAVFALALVTVILVIYAIFDSRGRSAEIDGLRRTQAVQGEEIVLQHEHVRQLEHDLDTIAPHQVPR